MPCDFKDMEIAHSLAEAQVLSKAALATEIPSYAIPKTAWTNIMAEAAGEDVPSVLFSAALGGAVVKSPILYVFDGRQTRGAHVDEIPEDLLALKHQGMFNIHAVLSGAVTACMAHTRPGYYAQDIETRTPLARFNPGITQDLMRRNLINTYTSSTQIHEARLESGDRVIFFERTSPTIDGPPNVIHLFHRGTKERYSETSRYFAVP